MKTKKERSASVLEPSSTDGSTRKHDSVLIPITVVHNKCHCSALVNCYASFTTLKIELECTHDSFLSLP